MFYAYLKNHALMLNVVLIFHMLSVKVGLVKNVLSILKFILENSLRLSNVNTSGLIGIPVHRYSSSLKQMQAQPEMKSLQFIR